MIQPLWRQHLTSQLQHHNLLLRVRGKHRAQDHRTDHTTDSAHAPLLEYLMVMMIRSQEVLGKTMRPDQGIRRAWILSRREANATDAAVIGSPPAALTRPWENAPVYSFAR